MSENATDCYDMEQLRLFLQESLPKKIEVEFLDHLDHCPDCQLSLEKCVGSQGQWDSICDKLESNGYQTWQPWQKDYSNISSGSSNQAGSADEISHGVGRLLEILNPSEYPRSVGCLGNYEVFGLIGQGSAGIVLKAFDPKLHRFVAIKVLSPSFSDNGPARRRFQREAKAIAAVNHQQVVPIHAVSEFKGLPYIVMPYLAGGSLQQRIEKEGPLGTWEVVRISLQIAKGLAEAHRQGIVHRDVKPANVLLEEGVDRALVGDFGLARVSDDAAATRSGVIAGTPHFMSPEQASGGAVDPRSDLFSLGSVMYCACTGRLPFQSDSIFGVIKKVCDSQPESVLKLNPNIDPWLADFIGVLHQKEKEMRFSSATEVADLLQAELAYHNNPKVSPLPNRTVYSRKQSFLRRNTALVASVLLIAAVGLGTVAASSIAANRSDGNGFGGVPLLSFLQEKDKDKSKSPKTASDSVTGTQEKGKSKSASASTSKSKSKSKAEKGTKSKLVGSVTNGTITVKSNGTVQERIITNGKSWSNTQQQKAGKRKSLNEILRQIEKLPKFTSDVKHSVKVKPGGTLYVDSSYSDVYVVPSDVQKANIMVRRIVRAKDQKDADQLFQHHKVSFTEKFTNFKAGSDASVKTWFTEAYHEARKEAKNQLNPFRHIYIRVEIPRNFQINVRTKAGDISLPHLEKRSKIKMSQTPVFKGNVDIKTLGGDIHLGNIDGRVTAVTVGGDVSVSSSTGDVVMLSQGGDLNAGVLKGKAKLTTGGGDIDVNEFAKPSSAETAGGDISVRKCDGGLKAMTQGGDISVRFTSDPIIDSVVTTQAGEIDITMQHDVNCNVDAKVMVGRIDGLRRGKRRGNHLVEKLGKGGKQVKIRTTAGEIDFRLVGKKSEVKKKEVKNKK